MFSQKELHNRNTPADQEKFMNAMVVIYTMAAPWSAAGQPMAVPNSATPSVPTSQPTPPLR